MLIPASAKMEPVSEFLVAFLTSIDERLLYYLDQDDELMFDTVDRLRDSTTALLAGAIAPAVLNGEWPDWFILAPAFVLAYGTEELKELQDDAGFLKEHEVGLDEADRHYLRALESRLGMYSVLRAEQRR